MLCCPFPLPPPGCPGHTRGVLAKACVAARSQRHPCAAVAHGSGWHTGLGGTRVRASSRTELVLPVCDGAHAGRRPVRVLVSGRSYRGACSVEVRLGSCGSFVPHGGTQPAACSRAIEGAVVLYYDDACSCHLPAPISAKHSSQHTAHPPHCVRQASISTMVCGGGGGAAVLADTDLMPRHTHVHTHMHTHTHTHTCTRTHTHAHAHTHT